MVHNPKNHLAWDVIKKKPGKNNGDLYYQPQLVSFFPGFFHPPPPTPWTFLEAEDEGSGNKPVDVGPRKLETRG